MRIMDEKNILQVFNIVEKKMFVSNSHVKKIVWSNFDSEKNCMIRLIFCDTAPTLLMVRP